MKLGCTRDPIEIKIKIIIGTVECLWWAAFPGVQLVLSGWMLVETRISCAADWSHPFECPGFDYRGPAEFPRWRRSFSRCLLKSSADEGLVFRGWFTRIGVRKFRLFEPVSRNFPLPGRRRNFISFLESFLIDTEWTEHCRWLCLTLINVSQW